MAACASREIWAYAIGTHDPNFIALAPSSLGIDWTDAQLEADRKEVALAAERVKSARSGSGPEASGSATLHPIVEGIVAVARAVANDTRAILAVGTLDPESPEGLYYSVPCTLGRSGVVHRHVETLDHPTRRRLEESLEPLRRFLAEADT